MRILPLHIGARSLCSAVAVSALALSFSGCSDDVPAVPADELYLRGFVKQFGVPAEGHTWSMAEPVDAAVSLAPGVNGTVTFYTASPTDPAARVLAETTVSAGRAGMRFDLRSGTRMVYARVLEGDGTVAFSGYVDVAGGRVNVSESGARSGECPVTATPLDYPVRRMDDQKLGVLKEFFAAHPEAYNMSWHEIESIINDNTVLGSVDGKEEYNVPNLYLLSGMDFSGRTPVYSITDIDPIVHKYINVDGEEKLGVFAESSDAGSANNIEKFYHGSDGSRKLDPTVAMSVRETGPVSIDLMWRAQTENTIWGYYYYDDEDEKLLSTDPLAFYRKVPKYIVFSGLDGGGQSSTNPIALSANNSLLEIRYCVNKDKHSLPGYHNPDDDTPDHTLGDWENLTGTSARSIYNQAQFYSGALLRGVRFNLTYFGPDGKGEPTYDFPAGTRIAFFIGRANDPNKFYLSNTRLNYYIFHYHYGGGGNVKETADYFPFAAKFAFMGNNYVGFEDGGLDNDLNDVVFRIHNTWPPEQDVTPSDLPVPDAMSWLVACEDLGTTDDYDFNDIVLQVSRIAGTEVLRVKPLACGGTLDNHIYFGSTADADYWNEIHALLGVPSGTMVGVGNGYADIDFSKVEEKEFPVAASWLASENYGDFHIFSQHPDAHSKTEGFWVNKETTPEGNSSLRAPQILLLPADWRWPVERCNIATAYPGFRNWLQNPADYDNYGWTTAADVDTSKLYQRID